MPVEPRGGDDAACRHGGSIGMQQAALAFCGYQRLEILDQIPQFSPYASMVKQAPLAIVVCGCLDKTLEGTEQEFWIQDCSAATENILLMAHGLGLGGVWTALYPLKERYEGMQQLLHLPKTMIPLNTLIIGYPKNLAEAKDKWKEENVSYNKWMEKNS